MMTKLSFVFVFLLLTITASALDSPRKTSGLERLHEFLLKGTCNKTPKTFESDFQDSCDSIHFWRHRCSSAWSSFKSAFAYKNPATVTPRDYDAYYDTLPIFAGYDQSLFWSGTFDIVSVISQNDLGVTVVSSANTPSAEIINSIDDKTEGYLDWCGRRVVGIDYFTPCDCNVPSAFWHQFSVRFSEVAKGNAIFLGDGERAGGAYSSTSYFATVEIPNMNPDLVDRVVVLIVHRFKQGESCRRPYAESLSLLKGDVESRGFSYDCYDLFGPPGETESFAKCAAEVIGWIQTGTEDGRQNYIDCRQF